MTESMSILQRLEEVTTRLEQLYSASSKARPLAGGGGASANRGPPPPPELPDFIIDFDRRMGQVLEGVTKAGEGVGVEAVVSATEKYVESVMMLRNLLLLTTITNKPSDVDWQAVLAPVMELGKAVGALGGRACPVDYVPHIKGIVEAMNIVMVFVTPGNPKAVIANCLESADYYLMQVLRRKVDTESSWVKAIKGSLTALMDYFNDDERFKMGIMWKVNSNVSAKDFITKHALTSVPWPASIASQQQQPVTAAVVPTAKGHAPPPPPSSAKGKAPPPPPPSGGGMANGAPPSHRAAAPPPPPAVPGGMSAVFADIRKIGTEGKSLKHVTKDMKTKNIKQANVSHKYLTAVNGNGSSKGGSVKAAAAATTGGSVKPPRCEVLRDNWIVENYIKHPEVLELPDVTMKQLVYISNSINTTIQIPTKCKSVCIDGCKNVQLVLESVISSVELVNCESCRVQTIGCVPCVSIDKCSGVQLFLSKASLDCAITTSKSSEMNLNIPISNDGEYKEMPIPEQFVHKLTTIEDPAKAKLHSDVSDLYA